MEVLRAAALNRSSPLKGNAGRQTTEISFDYQVFGLHIEKPTYRLINKPEKMTRLQRHDQKPSVLPTLPGLATRLKKETDRLRGHGASQEGRASSRMGPSSKITSEPNHRCPIKNAISMAALGEDHEASDVTLPDL